MRVLEQISTALHMRRIGTVTVEATAGAAQHAISLGIIFCIVAEYVPGWRLKFMTLRIKRNQQPSRTQRDNTGGPFVLISSSSASMALSRRAPDRPALRHGFQRTVRPRRMASSTNPAIFIDLRLNAFQVTVKKAEAMLFLHDYLSNPARVDIAFRSEVLGRC